MPSDSSCSCIAFSLCGRWVAAGTYDGQLRLLDADTATVRWSVQAHTESVTSLAWAASVVVSGSKDASVAVWNAHSSAAITRFDAGAAVFAVAINDDLVAAGCGPELDAILGFPRGKPADPAVMVWQLGSGQPPAVLRQHAETVLAVAFLNRRKLVAGSGVTHIGSRPELLLWDIGAPNAQAIGSHAAPITDLQVTLDGVLLRVLFDDGTIQQWAAAELGDGIGVSHRQEIRQVVFSMDGRRVVTTSWDDPPRLWDTASGRPIGDLAGHSTLVRTVEFAPDSRTIITGAGPKYPRPGRDTTARLWDAETGAPRGVLDQHEFPVTLARFFRGGELIVTGESDLRSAVTDIQVLHVWDAQTLNHVEQIGSHQPRDVVFFVARNDKLELRAGIDRYGIEMNQAPPYLRGQVVDGLDSAIYLTEDSETTLGWLPDIPSQFTHFASPALQPIIAVVNGADLHLYVMEKG